MYDAGKTSQKISDLEREYRKSQQKKGAESLIELEAQVRAKLDEESRSEFYRIRTHRKNDGILSAREIDLLTLEAMERSYYHYKGIEYEKPKYKKEFHFGG